MADFSGRMYAHLVGSGFQALQCALLASGVQAGVPVIVPTVTCPSVFHAVKSVGAEPVVLDVAADIPLLAADLPSPDRIRHVIVPHMFGLVRDLAPLIDSGYRVIEDCAQAQRPLCDSAAQLSVFSFSPTKLQTIGYAGAVVTDDPVLHARMQHLLEADEAVQCIEGLPFRLHAPVSDFQCAMLNEQLRRYPQTLRLRHKWMERYDQLLGEPDRMHPVVPFRYQLILEPGRDSRAFASAMRERGVMAWPLGSSLLHEVFNIPGEYPNAERWRHQLLSLPLHEGLDERQLQRVFSCYQEVSA